MNGLADTLARALPAEQVPGPAARERVERYVGLVLAWGQRINLTGARDAATFVDEHVLDALRLAPHLPDHARLALDVGSGAGLPGIVLACVRDEPAWILLEPNGKKRAFLQHVVRELGLGKVSVRAERVDAFLEGGGAGQPVDVVVSRAVWPLPEWIARARALLGGAGGRILGLEGAAAHELPADAHRFPYRSGARTGAVVVVDVPASADS